MKRIILMASVLIFTLTGIGFAGPRGFGLKTRESDVSIFFFPAITFLS